MEPDKTGAKTSELWLAVVASAAVLILGFFGATKAQTDELSSRLTSAATELTALLTTGLMIYRYIKSRETVKVEAIAAQATVSGQTEMARAVAANPNLSVSLNPPPSPSGVTTAIVVPTPPK